MRNARKTMPIMEGGYKEMERCDYSCLPNGGEDMGMTNEQYKGMLLDQLENWQRILKLAVKNGDAEIQEEVELQIAKINEKLKF